MAKTITPSDEFATAMQQLSAEAEKSLPAGGSKYGGSIANDAAFAQLSRKLEDLTSRFEHLGGIRATEPEIGRPNQ